MPDIAVVAQSETVLAVAVEVPADIAVVAKSDTVLAVAVEVPAEIAVVIHHNNPGPQGIQGIPGPAGEGGGEGGPNSYTHIQELPANVWTMPHNLGYPPAVFIEDTSGNEIEGDITHLNVNVTIATFSASFAGRAYLT